MHHDGEGGVSLNLTAPFILFVVFLVLKLTGTIAWSWWWISSPMWIPITLAFLVVVIVSIFDL